MPHLPNLSSLGKLCSSGHADEGLVVDRVKRKNSVRRMSIIEDGNVSEVLYLIPKQSMMEQLPFINPNDYVICERMSNLPDMAASGKEDQDVRSNKTPTKRSEEILGGNVGKGLWLPDIGIGVGKGVFV